MKFVVIFQCDPTQSAASRLVLTGQTRKIDFGGFPNHPPLNDPDELDVDILERISDRRCGTRNPSMTTCMFVAVEQPSFGGSALSCPAERHSAVVALAAGFRTGNSDL